jgi:truncated hemoglobin YjbI
MIERLVLAFYTKVRGDALLGPIFEQRIPDWEPQLQRMCVFWSSVALMSGRYHGSPMIKHLPLPIDADHFDRWLSLLEEAGREVCPSGAEAHFLPAHDELQRVCSSALRPDTESYSAAAKGFVKGRQRHHRSASRASSRRRATRRNSACRVSGEAAARSGREKQLFQEAGYRSLRNRSNVPCDWCRA